MYSLLWDYIILEIGHSSVLVPATEPEIPSRRCREGLPSYGEEARGRNFPRLRTYCSRAKRRRSSRNWPPPDVARQQ